MRQKTDEQKRRVVALLTREEIEFLDQLAIESSFSTGHKLSMTDVLSALVKAAAILHVSGKGISNKEELLGKILNALDPDFERRRFPRLHKRLEVGFRMLDSLADYRESQTANISVGGFCLSLAKGVKPPVVHEVIEVTLRDSQESEEPIKAMGRVVWVRENEKTGGFEAGVKLTFIDMVNKEKFLGYLNDKRE